MPTRILFVAFFLFLFVISFAEEPADPYRIFRETTDYVTDSRESSTPMSFRVEALLNIAKAQRKVGDEEGMNRSVRLAREMTEEVKDSNEKIQSLELLSAFAAGRRYRPQLRRCVNRVEKNIDGIRHRNQIVER